MTWRHGVRRGAAVIAAASLALSASTPNGTSAPAQAADTSGRSSAAPRRFAAITGTLTKKGLTVIALAADGKATSRPTKSGRFTLKPPAETVTLHLKRPDGKYAGPVVVNREGNRAILGVEAGADLGRIKVRSGYARVSGQPSEADIDPSRWSRAKSGVPIGARVYGRVKSRPKPGKVPGDQDLDGIPNSLDIDDDGDRILDNFESKGKKRRARGLASAVQSDNPFGLYSVFAVELRGARNANAAGLTPQDIDESLRANSHLFFDISDFIERGASVELDCTGLSYCSAGGTGELWCSPGPGCAPQAFPECCDADGDGFGDMGSDIFFRLAPRAPADQIGTGDVLIARVTAGGVETEFPTTLQAVFATVPALASYGDTAGNAASIAYPVHEGNPGSTSNPLPVAAGSDGNVVLTFTFWRPQRNPIPGEGDPQWIDVGGLSYYTGFIEYGPSGSPVCPASAYSSTHPELVPAVDQPVGGFRGGFTDLAPDRPANPGNTFTYSVNMTQCLADFGQAWGPGEKREIVFYTRDASFDDTRLIVYFRRQ